MVDIDRAFIQFAAEIIRQDLHVACQHHEVGARILDQFE
jgi:hypothetical protein